MAKHQKYEVEFRKSDSSAFAETGGYWQIWFMDDYLTFYKADSANKACEAFNMMERLKVSSVQRKLEALGDQIRMVTEALAAGTEETY